MHYIDYEFYFEEIFITYFFIFPLCPPQHLSKVKLGDFGRLYKGFTVLDTEPCKTKHNDLVNLMSVSVI